MLNRESFFYWVNTSDSLLKEIDLGVFVQNGFEIYTDVSKGPIYRDSC